MSLLDTIPAVNGWAREKRKEAMFFDIASERLSARKPR
jgi:hypothetical protein